jgi:hypothetical protein
MKQILDDHKGLLVEADFEMVKEPNKEEHLQEDNNTQPKEVL